MLVAQNPACPTTCSVTRPTETKSNDPITLHQTKEKNLLNSNLPAPNQTKQLNSNLPAPNQKKPQFETPPSHRAPDGRLETAACGLSGRLRLALVIPWVRSHSAPFFGNGVLPFPSDAECGLSPAVLFFFFFLFSNGYLQSRPSLVFRAIGNGLGFHGGGGGIQVVSVAYVRCVVGEGEGRGTSTRPADRAGCWGLSAGVFFVFGIEGLCIWARGGEFGVGTSTC